MIAEYRRILKNPTPERRKKCIFFDALHRIYQAKNSNRHDQHSLNIGYSSDFADQSYHLDPVDFSNAEEMCDNEDENMSDEDRNELFAYSMSPTSFSGNNFYDNNSIGWFLLFSNNIHFANFNFCFLLSSLLQTP